MKKETLEEASWRFNPLKKLDGEFLRDAFIKGAKWQQEKMYSEEIIKSICMKKNKKQTATEYLFEKLWETPKDKLTWNAILEQAKEMEKEQIIDAVNFINNNLKLDEDKTGFFTTTGDGYYRNTYGE